MKTVLLVAVMIFFALVLGVGAQPPTLPVPEKVDMERAKGYQIGPGDEITIKVVGEPDFDFVARVNEDGKLDVPFDDNPMDARCKTERQLRSDMKQMLAKYLRNPQFNLRVTDENSRPPATIFGEVEKPQQVKLMRQARLIELLSVASGVKEEAGGTIQVFRTQTPICTEDDKDAVWKAPTNDPTDVPSRIFSLAEVRAGKQEANPIIYPGDVIVVQKAAPVYVTGEVISSQGIFLKEGGTTLMEALSKVGGVRPGADKQVKIYRLKPNSKERETISANLELIKTNKQTDPLLQPYDLIEVGKAKDSIGKTILSIALGAARTGVSSVSNSLGYRVIY